MQALVDIMEGLEGGVHKVITCECVNHVGGGFGLTPEPLKDFLYLLLQVQHGSSYQQKVTGARGGQERVSGQGGYQVEGGNGGSGDINCVGC